MSMLTGLYPTTHAVKGSAPLDDALPMLAERLREAGYESAAFTEDGLLSAGMGFRRGFAYYHEDKDVRGGAGNAEGTFARALAWAKQQGEEPYFLFIHTYEVHASYLPPEYTAERSCTCRPLLEGAKLERSVVFGESPKIGRPGRWFVARSADAKCMVSEQSGQARCFDLIADPSESTPLSAARRPELVALEQEVMAYRDRSLRSGRAEPDEDVIETEGDPERREKLKVLGYLD